MSQSSPSQINAAIFAGCLVAFLGFGFSATFGVFMRPMSADLGWGREVFSLSVAVQALAWGLTQPFAGIVADRYGTGRVLGFGALASALGFYLRGVVDDPTLFVLTGIIVGMGTGACAFPVVIVALGKIVTPKQRSFVMGLGTAAASLGMVVASYASVLMIERLGWQMGVNIIAASFLLIIPTLWFIARVGSPSAGGQGANAFGHAIKTAFGQIVVTMCLFFGFFRLRLSRCLYRHSPARLHRRSGPIATFIGGWSLGLIGLFNIALAVLRRGLGRAKRIQEMDVDPASISFAPLSSQPLS